LASLFLFVIVRGGDPVIEKVIAVLHP